MPGNFRSPEPPIPAKDRPNAAQHGGSGAMYNNGCKCEDCLLAHRERIAEMREERHRKLLAGEVNPPHGSTSTYSNYGCRCEDCVAAQSEKNRTYRESRKQREAS